MSKRQTKKTTDISTTQNVLLSDDKSRLINVFKNCLNIMRDNEGLTGQKALRNMSYLLILKLIEQHIDNDIDFNNYEYDFSYDFSEYGYTEDKCKEHKQKLMYLVRFTNLVNEKDVNIPIYMEYLWNDILSVHPSTKNIFLKGKSFDIQHQSTYRKLIDKLNSLDLTQTEYDILGNAYEEVIQDIMTGKVLGQFFTQPLVKKMMVKLIDPQINTDGRPETCGDPTMGTGGFLITYLQYILQQAKTKNIIPDWDFIKTEGLYGKELEPDTYQLAVSNMLISSGHMFEQLDRGDSIREPITRKFDNILANPPYGIKGLKYDDFQSTLKAEYIPIKTDNAVSLFIQAIIYMLKIGGKCAVVLPDGQDLFSKTNTTLVTIREYLMKTCDLKEIIYLPSGIFTYTSIKTCVFYFVKKREGSDVLDTKIKISKVSKKETGREYKFSKTYQTTKVKFYDYNPYEDVKNLLVEVPIDNIVNNSYSLNYAEYIKDEKEEEYDEDIIIKTLGELCKFLPKSKRNAKYGDTKGLYPFFKSSIKVDSYVDIPDYDEESLIIGDGGEPNINYGIKFSTSDHCYILQNKNKSILNLKYTYYYVYHNLDMLKQFYTGIGIKNISKTNIEGIKIPIPSFTKQQDIVKYLDFIYEKANKISNDKIAELKKLNELCLNNQKIFYRNNIKTLGEVCKVNQGTYIKSDMKIQGEYPVYGGGDISFYINQYNRENEIIIAKDGVSANCVRYEKNKFFLNHHGWSLICKEQIIKKYMFYYLQSIQIELLSIAKGTAQLGINQENFYKLKIPIPSLERQKEIIKYCDHNDMLIKQLKQEIQNNKKQAEIFMSEIIKSQINDNQDNNLINEDNHIEDIEELKTRVKKSLVKDNEI
jgi:type I restriction-modification system DNA methylase subunit/restriction endonuclease S subunit